MGPRIRERTFETRPGKRRGILLKVSEMDGITGQNHLHVHREVDFLNWKAPSFPCRRLPLEFISLLLVHFGWAGLYFFLFVQLGSLVEFTFHDHACHCHNGGVGDAVRSFRTYTLTER